MAAKEKSGVGKIILIVVGILVLVSVICCGFGWFFVGGPAVEFGQATEKFKETLVAEFGEGVRIQPIQRGQQNILLGVGFPADEELTPERVQELQDRVWALYSETYIGGGFPFCKGIAIGHGQGSVQSGYVVDYEQNIATNEEMVERTGVSAPPASKLTQWVPDNAKIKIETNGRNEDEPVEDPQDVPIPDTPDNE